MMKAPLFSRSRPNRPGIWSPPRGGIYAPGAASSLVNAYSVEFDGVSEYMGTDADDTLASKSYSFWAKSTETGANSVFDHGARGTGAFHFNWDSGRAFLFLHEAGGGGYLYRYWVDNSAQDDGNWHHHVLYLEHDDITNCKWYVDGVLQTATTTNATGTAESYTTGIRIGRGGSTYFDGLLDEFSVFDGELSPADIVLIFSGGNPTDLSPFSPEHWWRMGDSGTATSAVEDVAGDENGSLFNGPSYELDVP